MGNVRALTLWQPWASLVAWGEKRIETRSWLTTYRGPMVIHAAKRFAEDERELCRLEPFLSAFRRAGTRRLADLPLGAGLCLVDLVEVIPTEQAWDDLTIDEKERAFGDYSSGRFAWKLENVRPFPEPILARGYQQLWRWPLKIETIGEHNGKF